MQARIDSGRGVGRPGERLEDALDHVVGVASVVEQDVEVALGAVGEGGEELLGELAVEGADRRRSRPVTAQENDGRPPKSMAQVTSTSSMGRVAQP